MTFGRAQMATEFANLGIRLGATLVVHSSLRSLGPVEGGAEAVVAALTDVIGATGLIVFPTFTYWSRFFDPDTTPSQTGRITEVARKWPGAIRSWHPTHSVAAIGLDAEVLCAMHHAVGPLSLDSPLDRLVGRGGYVLLLGVGHNANSTIHIGEAHARAPYLDIPFSLESPIEATVATPSGPMDVEIKAGAGCSKAFGAVENVLRAHGSVRDGIVGRALVQLVPSQAVIAATIEILHADPARLLCTDPHCYRCVHARRRLNGEEVTV